jgi:hypothetical protein
LLSFLTLCWPVASLHSLNKSATRHTLI